MTLKNLYKILKKQLIKQMQIIRILNEFSNTDSEACVQLKDKPKLFIFDLLAILSTITIIAMIKKLK